MGGNVSTDMQNPEPGRTSTVPASAATPVPPDGRPGNRIGSRLVSATMTSYATAALLVILVVVFWAALPAFRTERNWSALLVTQAVTAALALAALLPLIVGEFDLSLGYSLGFLAMVGAWLSGRHQSALAVIAVMIVGGAAVGLVNGVLNVGAHIGSFIATLGVGTILSALTEGISGGNVLFSGIPVFVTDVGQNKLGGVAIAVWCTVAVAIICHYGLAHTPMGRRLYAIGGSERVAYLAGVRTGRLKIAAFVLAGVLVGVGAVFQLGQAGAAQPGFGPDLLLPAYGAAFLGITAYRPGYYNVPGTIIAILLLAVGFNGLSLLGVPFWVQPLFNGAVLLVAVMLARAESRHLTSV
jgi:ribose transport system permease protein